MLPHIEDGEGQSYTPSVIPRTGGHQEPELFDSALDPQNFCLGPSLTKAMRLSAERMERVIAEANPTHIIATVSGGRDSAAEIEFARELGIKIDLILHCRSGECMCGTMQSMQTRMEAAAIYPEWGAQLDDLERRVRAKHGWGWGETMPKPADPRQVEMFQPMCVGCARDNQRDAIETLANPTDHTPSNHTKPNALAFSAGDAGEVHETGVVQP